MKDLVAAIVPVSGPPAQPAIILGTIDTSDEAYQNTAFVQEFDLDAAALEAVQSSPTAILLSADNPTVVAQENPTGAYANFDQYVWRLNPGDKEEVTLWANIFEKPAAKQTIPLALYAAQFGPAPPPFSVPTNAIDFPSTVTTNSKGQATFTITAGNPKNPRVYIDGQIYGIQQQWPMDTNPDPTGFVSVHIFDAVPVPDAPTWWQHVQPILNQYAVLYPAMRQIIQINDYDDVVAKLKPILNRLQLGQDDPLLMPITRELSKSKLQIILKWAANGHPEGMAPGPQ